MQITIINDCCDQNARLRQVSRAGSLFKNASVNCFGVRSEIEAAGFLVDAIDAFEGREGIVLVNVAPRNKNNETSKNRHWKNGTPFGYFWYRKTLIISSVDGFTLSLVKKLQITDEIFTLNISKVLDEVKSDLSETQKQRIINSQFRSFDFLPRAAKWLWEKQDLPKEKISLSEIKNIYPAVWLVDNFGNIKTTLLEDELNYVGGGKAEIKIKYQEKTIKEKFAVYKHLKDLPENEIGLIVGSSGFEDKRFMEIILNGGNAIEHINI